MTQKFKLKMWVNTALQLPAMILNLRLIVQFRNIYKSEVHRFYFSRIRATFIFPVGFHISADIWSLHNFN